VERAPPAIITTDTESQQRDKLNKKNEKIKSYFSLGRNEKECRV
jgi:hypothetical protein